MGDIPFRASAVVERMISPLCDDARLWIIYAQRWMVFTRPVLSRMIPAEPDRGEESVAGNIAPTSLRSACELRSTLPAKLVTRKV